MRQQNSMQYPRMNVTCHILKSNMDGTADLLAHGSRMIPHCGGWWGWGNAQIYLYRLYLMGIILNYSSQEVFA